MNRKAVVSIALLSCIAVATDVHAQRRPASRAQLTQSAPAQPAADSWVNTRNLAQAGFPIGLKLNGPSDHQTVSFRLPAPATVTEGHLQLKIHFGAGLIPQSNLQVYVNTSRLATISRADADPYGVANVTIPVPASLLNASFLPVTFRSSFATMENGCLDGRLGLPHAEIDPESNFSYTLPIPAVNTVQTALAILPDTLTMSVPARRLDPFEFWSAYTAASELERQGYAVRFTQLPQLGDITIAKHEEIAAAEGISMPPSDTGNVAIYRYAQGGTQHVGVAISGDSTTAGAHILGATWMPLGNAAAMSVRQANAAFAPTENDPTFADLRMPDLQHYLGVETTWHLGLDLRDLPPGRVPTQLDLRVATAPNTSKRQMVMFVFWNGTLVRSTDLSTDGLPQSLSVDVPSGLVTTRNEIRVTMQRHIDPVAECQQSDSAFPAQILPTSRILTGTASSSLEAFDGVAARLGNTSPLYLPDDALDHPDRYLPMLVGVGRAFWMGARSPRPTFYGGRAPTAPTGAFILVGQPTGVNLESPIASRSGRLTIHRKDTRDTILDISDMSSWSVAQVVKWNGQVGVQLLPSAAVGGGLPSYPEAYGSSDVVVARGDSATFPLRTGGVRGTLVINDGPSLWSRIRRDWMLWALFLAVLILVPVALGVNAVIRRTPRRDVRRSTPTRPPVVPR